MDINNILGVPSHNQEMTAQLNSNTEAGRAIREYFIRNGPSGRQDSPGIRPSRPVQLELPDSYPTCTPLKHYLICFPRFVFRNGPIRAHARHLGPVHKAEFRTPKECGRNCVHPCWGPKCAEGRVSCIKCIEVRFVRKMVEVQANIKLAREVQEASLTIEDEDLADNWEGDLLKIERDLVTNLPACLRAQYQANGLPPLRRRAERRMRKDKGLFQRSVALEGYDTPSEHSDDEDDADDDYGDTRALDDAQDADQGNVSHSESDNDSAGGDDNVDVFHFFNHRHRQINGVPPPGSSAHSEASQLFHGSMLWMMSDQLFLWEREHSQNALEQADLLDDIYRGRWSSILLLLGTVTDFLHLTGVTESSRTPQWQRATYLLTNLHLLGMITGVLEDPTVANTILADLVDADSDLDSERLSHSFGAAWRLGNVHRASGFHPLSAVDREAIARKNILREAMVERYAISWHNLDRMPFELSFGTIAVDLVNQRIGLIYQACPELAAAAHAWAETENSDDDTGSEEEDPEAMLELDMQLLIWTLTDTMALWELEHHSNILENREASDQIVSSLLVTSFIFRDTQEHALAQGGLFCRSIRQPDGMPFYDWRCLTLRFTALATGEVPAVLDMTMDELVAKVGELIDDAEERFGADAGQLRIALDNAREGGASCSARAERRREIWSGLDADLLGAHASLEGRRF